MSAPKRSVVIIAFAALYLIWGSTYLGIRFSIETIHTFNGRSAIRIGGHDHVCGCLVTRKPTPP